MDFLDMKRLTFFDKKFIIVSFLNIIRKGCVGVAMHGPSENEIAYSLAGGHLELFDRLDDADKWPGSIGRHSDFYSAQAGP